MTDPSLWSLARGLIPLVQAASRKASQLHAERTAGHTPVDPTLMEINLDVTLGRLQGGNVDEPWWQNILDQIGLAYVAPDFLKKPALRGWLGDRHVADDLKILAKAMLMPGTSQDLEIRERLRQSYSEVTGEGSQFADLPVDTVVGILVAGYLASIPSGQRPLAGMVQALSVQLSEGLGRIERAQPSPVEDPILQQAHTECAEQELAKFLSLRSFDSIRSRRLKALLGRLQSGDLVAASDAVKTTVEFWAARTFAAESDMVEQARLLRDRLRESHTTINLAIVEALIAETDGDRDAALRFLRDHNDPDSRTVMFGVLTRAGDQRAAISWFENQYNQEDPHFFEPIGWAGWGLCMAKLGRWEEASNRLVTLQDRWDEMPALAYAEGCINAAMILPLEYRKDVLDGGFPLYVDMVPNQGTSAEYYHSRARTCFEFLGQRLQNAGIQDLVEGIADWNLWLRLMDPRSRNADNVRDEVGQQMTQGEQAVHLTPFAYVFDIPFDTEALKDYLEERKLLGGLDDRELYAECLLLQRSLSPRDFVNYLRKNRSRLDEVMPLQHLSQMHVKALVDGGRSNEARKVSKEYGDTVGGNHYKRLTLLIDNHEGKDTRKQLEDLYHETRSPGDLRNLTSYLQGIGDWAALRPLARELFGQAPTVRHALSVVTSLGDPSCFDQDSIIDFLEENADLLEQSDDLKSVKAFALMRAGRLREAREINDGLLNQKINHENLVLGIGLAIASGDWEGLGAIMDPAWGQRDILTSYDLMALAQLMAEQDPTPNRALQLARLAAENAPDDPRILIGAYWLYLHLGQEAEADPAWFRRAYDLSSGDEGPLWQVTLDDLVTNRLPEQQDHLRDVERKWLASHLPITCAAGRHNVPLARMLLHFPVQNAGLSDGRHRAVLPIMSGRREAVELQRTWKVGLDVTSIMVLFHLGLLDKALDAFHHVKLAPNLMSHLFRERGEVPFHQPSLVEAANRVLALRTGNQLGSADIPSRSPKMIADEVGAELGALLQLARQENGKVVCALPIYKAGSLMKQQAETSSHEDLILPIMDFCKLLYDEGKIGSDDYQRAHSFLRMRGQEECTDNPRSMTDGPVYVDRLALNYLQDAQLLQRVAGAGLGLQVHPLVIREMDGLAQEGETGRELIRNIEEIRHIVRNALDSGKASFLPHVSEQKLQIQSGEIRYETTTSLLAGSSECDALCIDDRFINRHSHMPVSSEREIPIGCALDVLRYLVSLGSISESDCRLARHKLRLGGFAYVPLESTELIHWLKASKVNDSLLTECMELKVLRQAAARADSLIPTNSQEMTGLIANCRTACVQAIIDMWQDQELSPEEAAQYSNWIWCNLMLTAIPGHGVLPYGDYGNCVREVVASRLANLLLPTVTRPQDRHAHYIDWVDRFVLQPLRPANADRIERALTATREAIRNLDIDQEAYGNIFLRRLPENVRRTIIARDPEFAHRCGYQEEQVLSVGPAVQMVCFELFTAAEETFATGRGKTLRDLTGNEVWLDLDTQNGDITIEWTDAGHISRHVDIPELALLSPEREKRVAALHAVIGRLGCTVPGLARLLEDVRTRALSHHELSSTFDELANGVAAVQANLVQKIEHGSRFSVADAVPRSMAYFERLVSRHPVVQEPDEHLQEVLVPYRKKLLNRDIATGLDICCLGAVHDELSPGQWVAGYDHDVIWNALSSCRTKSNPFSLLGALDVALYRLEDERFEKFAVEAVSQLSDENFGQQSDFAPYRLLLVCVDFVFNQISLLDNGSTYPNFWKRLSAWMQGGLIARSMVESSLAIDLDSFQAWTQSNTVAAGAYAEITGARREPMLLAGRIAPQALRLEIFGRLHTLRTRHEDEGRWVPGSEAIDRAEERIMKAGLPYALGLPGPFDGHRRPTTLVPEEVRKSLGQLAASSAEMFPRSLVMASQLYALGQPELERTVRAVQNTAESGQDDVRSALTHLELASVVASANRDTALADAIADAVTKVCPKVSEEEVQMIPTILLQAAAAHEAQEAWYKWLEEKFADVAYLLPAPPSKALATFLAHLDEMQKVLPADSWFHGRARTIALAGA